LVFTIEDFAYNGLSRSEGEMLIRSLVVLPALLLLLLGMAGALAETGAGGPAGAPGMLPGIAGDDLLTRSGDTLSGGLAAAAAGIADLGRQAAALHRALAADRALSPLGLPPELLLIAAVALCLAVEKLTVLGLAQTRRRLAAEGRGLALFATDLAGLAGFAAMALAFYDFGDGSTVAARTRLAVLGAGLYWRMWTIPVETVLRPALAGARPVWIDHSRASRAKYLVSGLVLAAMLALSAAGHVAGVASILCVTAALLFFVLSLLCLRRIVSDLILGRARTDPVWGGILRVTLARHWEGLALAVLLALYAAYLAAILVGEPVYYEALIRTAQILLLLGLVEALCARGLFELRRRTEHSRGNIAGASIGIRLLRALVRTTAVTVLAYTWLVHTLPPIAGSPKALGRSIVLAGATAFLAYLLWELLRGIIERRLGGVGAEDEDEAAGQPVPRLVTVMPVFRVGLAVALFTVTSLVVLTQVGVDTVPLIIAASVLGLALSLGAQSLVRDVVSGICFMAEDAFRTGEEIDTGRLRGTVEGMAVRSMRLRHQNGQLHTIPYGQLGAVSNFSRDWAAVNFDLRLSRDTNLEVLRRTVKRFGLELMEDPELAPQIIEPLKLQGLLEVLENAVVVRFKFTSLPANANWVQRTYLRHLYERLPASGIEFASNVVAVRAVGTAGAEPAATAGAAALTVVSSSAGVAATAQVQR
jgi:small-conductance mechanosensitive channel